MSVTEGLENDTGDRLCRMVKKRAEGLTSGVKSRQNIPLEKTVSPPIDNTTLEILKVIEMAWQNPFTTKSKYARKNADIVGIALEEGLITLIVTPGIYGTKYLISELGLTFLYNMKEQFAKEVFNKFTEGNLDDDKPTKT